MTKKLFVMKLFAIICLSILFLGCQQDEDFFKQYAPKVNINLEEPDLTYQNSSYQAHLDGSVSRSQGQLLLNFSKDNSKIFYKLQVANLYDPLAAHLHHAHNGEDTGHAILDLHISTMKGRVQGRIAEGMWDADDITCSCPHPSHHSIAMVRRHIEDGEMYVQVHTEEHPSGEIRGWIK